ISAIDRLAGSALRGAHPRHRPDQQSQRHPDERLGLPPDRRRTRMRHRMINKTSKISTTPFEAHQPR
ncbi:hypothetical protein ACI2T2_18650, partial [Ralstonia nicotianae]